MPRPLEEVSRITSYNVCYTKLLRVFELSITAWQAYSERLEAVPLGWLRTAKRAASKQCVADASRASLNYGEMVAETVALSRSLQLPRRNNFV